MIRRVRFLGFIGFVFYMSLPADAQSAATNQFEAFLRKESLNSALDRDIVRFFEFGLPAKELDESELIIQASKMPLKRRKELEVIGKRLSKEAELTTIAKIHEQGNLQFWKSGVRSGGDVMPNFEVISVGDSDILVFDAYQTVRKSTTVSNILEMLGSPKYEEHVYSTWLTRSDGKTVQKPRPFIGQGAGHRVGIATNEAELLIAIQGGVGRLPLSAFDDVNADIRLSNYQPTKTDTIILGAYLDRGQPRFAVTDIKTVFHDERIWLSPAKDALLLGFGPNTPVVSPVKFLGVENVDSEEQVFSFHPKQNELRKTNSEGAIIATTSLFQPTEFNAFEVFQRSGISFHSPTQHFVRSMSIDRFGEISFREYVRWVACDLIKCSLQGGKPFLVYPKLDTGQLTIAFFDKQTLAIRQRLSVPVIGDFVANYCFVQDGERLLIFTTEPSLSPYSIAYRVYDFDGKEWRQLPDWWPKMDFGPDGKRPATPLAAAIRHNDSIRLYTIQSNSDVEPAVKVVLYPIHK